ncbi:MAG: sugar phosphate isomerase/epimerase family protein [Spirochaetota bacterium]
MKLGICTTIENAATVASAGYDYIEPALNAVATLDETGFEGIREQFAALALPADAFNCFFPGSIRLTGPDVDFHSIESYLETALTRAASLGASIVVFGSGGSRRLPEAFPRERGLEQVARMLAVAGPIAGENGVTIVIEPLRSAEDNLSNTAAAGLELVEMVGHPNVRLLVDYYHMRSENESSEIVRIAGNGMLRHCHIARTEGRRWPKHADGEDYTAFFAALADIGYDGRLSVEGQTDDLASDASAAIAFLTDATGWQSRSDPQ